MRDLSADGTSGALIATAIDNDITLAIVCHGLAVLVAAARADGSSAAARRTVAAFAEARRRPCSARRSGSADAQLVES